LQRRARRKRCCQCCGVDGGKTRQHAEVGSEHLAQAAAGRFVFGPMVQIGWGAPKTVLTIDLAVVLELPAPVRLFILGRLRLLLPEERTAVVRLQLDALGVVDFESGDVALDAVLYESTITQFAVTGAMALRANFGGRPNFALAVGGFHPRFQAPDGFPALDRVAINLAAGGNPRLRLEAYLALTSNTVQFGANVDVYAPRRWDASSSRTIRFAMRRRSSATWGPSSLLQDVVVATTRSHRQGTPSVDAQLAARLCRLCQAPQPAYAVVGAARQAVTAVSDEDVILTLQQLIIHGALELRSGADIAASLI
jgi:uncharacterized protein DUF6603